MAVYAVPKAPNEIFGKMRRLLYYNKNVQKHVKRDYTKRLVKKAKNFERKWPPIDICIRRRSSSGLSRY